MKTLIALLLIVSLVSCSKKSASAVDNNCWLCKWNADQTGYVRPSFSVCGDGDWMHLASFTDERGNDIGGHCDKK